VKTIVVTAAIIERDGRYLVTRRQPGAHLAGVWEFPGGKCDDGEPLTSCMVRELNEELGINAAVGSEIFTITHDYPDRRIELHFFECQTSDAPSPLLGQGDALGDETGTRGSRLSACRRRVDSDIETADLTTSTKAAVVRL